MDDFVYKPLNRNRLLKALQRVSNIRAFSADFGVGLDESLSGDKITISDHPVLHKILVEHFDGDLEFFNDVLEKFIRLTYENAEKLKQDLSDKNRGGLISVLHTQKGMCLNMGLEEMAARIKSLEALVQSGAEMDPLTLDRLVNDLNATAHDLQQASQESCVG